MDALSASMGVCGSVGAGLGASANVPSIYFCSVSLSTFATPCICRKREIKEVRKGKRREWQKGRQKLTEEVKREAENETWRHHVKTESSWRVKLNTEPHFNMNPLESHEAMVGKPLSKLCIFHTRQLNWLNFFKKNENFFSVVINNKAERSIDSVMSC